MKVTSSRSNPLLTPLDTHPLVDHRTRSTVGFQAPGAATVDAQFESSASILDEQSLGHMASPARQMSSFGVQRLPSAHRGKKASVVKN